MSARILTRFYATAIAVFLVWPAVQWGLVTFANVDPWKLCGFAMYAMQHHVEVKVIDRSGEEARDITRALIPRAGKARKHFLRYRQVLGDLVSPDELAEMVFGSTDADRISVVVITWRLGPRSSTFESERRQYFYQRPV
ncbi:hypothetical protein MK489_05425 [Myxococcota bacterium]|nr:hypothetical protein [Myxococcota bacterium]